MEWSVSLSVEQQETLWWTSSVWSNALMPFLTCSDLGVLEQCASDVVSEEHWKCLLVRDFSKDDSGMVDKDAPYWSSHAESFSSMRTFSTFKHTYKAWIFFHKYTHGIVTCQDIRSSIDAWTRYKRIVAVRDEFGELAEEEEQLLLNSLQSAPPRYAFDIMTDKRVPSSYAAFLAVHGGQTCGVCLHNYTAGVFGYIPVGVTTSVTRLFRWELFLNFSRMAATVALHRCVSLISTLTLSISFVHDDNLLDFAKTALACCSIYTFLFVDWKKECMPSIRMEGPVFVCFH